jgi:hypothetical protein
VVFPLGLPLVFFLIFGTTAPGAMLSVERAGLEPATAADPAETRHTQVGLQRH